MSTGVLWLPPSLPTSTHISRASPCGTLCPGTPHPTLSGTCWPRVLPCWLGSKQGAVRCRAVPCCAEQVVGVLLPARHGWADRQSHPPSTQPYQAPSPEHPALVQQRFGIPQVLTAGEPVGLVPQHPAPPFPPTQQRQEGAWVTLSPPRALPGHPHPHHPPQQGRW